MGISWKFGPPSRRSWVSKYEWMRPASRGSLEKSMPGTRFWTPNATCSVSAKKLSGLRFSTMRPTGVTGTSSSGTILVAIEHVEAEPLRLRLGEDLEPELVLGEHAGLDRLPEVAARVVGIRAPDLHGLVPVQRVRARPRRPVELHEVGLAVGVDQPERVDPEALHHAEAAGERAVRHDPQQHVGRLRHQRDEVPERVVGARRLGHRVVRLGLHRMHQVRELHRVLDEEDRDVVPDEVEVPLVRVELRREPAHVARRVDGPPLARDGREAHEDRGALALLRQERGARVLRQRCVALEHAVRGGAAGVHDPLGDALVVEVGDLLPEDEVLQERGTAQSGLERVLVVGDGLAEVRREPAAAGVDAHAVEGRVGRD